MILLKSNPEIVSRLITMSNAKTEAKRIYVGEHHKFKISPLHAKGKSREGYWYTHIIVNGKRKVVQKPTEDKLYDFLYGFYRDMEDIPKTYDDLFEAYIKSKRSYGRSELTLREYRRINGFLSKKIRNKSSGVARLRTSFRISSSSVRFGLCSKISATRREPSTYITIMTTNSRQSATV